jgi:hypothetical protein
MTSYLVRHKVGRHGLLLIGFMAAIILIDSPTANAQLTTEHPGFCRSDLMVRDYLRPVTRLSETPVGPGSVELPFGPGTLKLIRPITALVVIGHDSFGPLGSSAATQTALRWSATSRLQQVDTHGRVLREVEEKRQYISRVSGFNRRDFGFSGRVQPGLYKLEVSFENAGGKTLGTYREFYRAVDPRSELGLRIYSRTIEAGSYGYLRVENYGTVKTSYSYNFRLWRLDDDERIPISLPPYVFTDERPMVRPGYVGHCFAFPVPEDLPAGTYEVGIWVKNRLLDERRSVDARFRVG